MPNGRSRVDRTRRQNTTNGAAEAQFKRSRAGIRFELKHDLTTKLKEHLPFELTGDQQSIDEAVSWFSEVGVIVNRMEGDVLES